LRGNDIITGSFADGVNNKNERKKMNKILLTSVALLAMTAASPVFAQSNADTGAAIGGTAGGASGAIVGGMVGGPIGAIVGGFAGAVLGADAGVSTAAVDYAVANPVEPVYLEGPVEVGGTLAGDVVIHDVPGEEAYGYAYVNNRVYLIERSSHKIVHSPAYIIPEKTVTYVEANPATSVTVEGDLAAGLTLDDGIELNAIPDDSSYSYVYINDRPALVDNSSRVVVWVK
jgi:hypothetical protein